MTVTDDFSLIEDQWSRVESHLNKTGRILLRADDVSGWSVGQQCLHLLKVADTTAGRISKLLHGEGDPPAAEKPAGNSRLRGEIPRGMAQAPPSLRVDHQPEASEILEALAGARTQWKAFADQADTIANSKTTLPHALIGPMTATGWLRFTGVHNEHHLKIIEDILKRDADRANEGS